MLLLTGAFLSIGLITNFLSLNEMFLISLQGNPIFGVSLQKLKAKEMKVSSHSKFLTYNKKLKILPNLPSYFSILRLTRISKQN